jgi:phosphocarrier protein HPr
MMADAADMADCPDAAPLEIPHVILQIINRKGLHARASAKFVQTVERFDAAVTVTRCGETVGGRSIMGLLTLGAAQGTTITVTAQGPQSAESLVALTELLANRFGEDE